VRVGEAAASRHPARAPALLDGEGFVVLVNPGAGVDGEHPGVELAAVWPAARQVFAEPGGDVTKHLEAELNASDQPVRALGVAGGDGTVAAVASVAARRRLPLVVVPAGTLNHFARDVGVTDLLDAVEAVRDGSAVAVTWVRCRSTTCHHTGLSTPRASAVIPTWCSYGSAGNHTGASGRRRPSP
ncbi:MAG: diacylglycerol kinase family protein, partial [Pseudonocardiaceae bacterium]